MSGLQIIRPGERPPQVWESALFLDGPMDPSPVATSWTEIALASLESEGYRGVVFVNERRPATESDEHRRWATHWRERADCLLLWFSVATSAAPLDLARLGEWSDSGRLVLGVAAGALDGVDDELRRWAASRGIRVADTLDETVGHALALLPPGARRERGERDVPLLIWNTHWFQGWYNAQRGAGNELVGVNHVWTFRVGPGRRRVMFWALNPRMRVGSEGRSMSSEVVIGRTDMSALLLYRRAACIEDTELVVVRDFRPAARTPDGYVWELPSGSGDTTDPEIGAVFEFAEETGLSLDPSRVRYHGAQQVWPTGAAHVVHLYSAEGRSPEIEYMRSQEGVAHGLHEQHEYTFPVVLTWRDVVRSDRIDWATKGMIAQVLAELE